MKKVVLPLFSILSLLVLLMCQPREKQEMPLPQPNTGLTIDSVDITRYFPDTLLNRFQEAIDTFAEKDSLNPPAPGQALFVGSSSIRMWDSLQADMHPIPVINRGFGGSTIPEILHYFEQLVEPYQPKVVLLYAGENDLAMEGAGITPEQVKETFEIFVNTVRGRLPGTEKIYFISVKPSVARWELWPEMEQANQMIQKYARQHDDVVFINVAEKMMDGDTVREDIFIEDNLHMNRKGYELWKETIKPELEKVKGF